MFVKGIQATVYFVSNWDQAITFYRDKLGLRPLVIVPQVWAQFEAPGGGRIALQLQPHDRSDPPHVSIDVGDIRSFVGELQAKGVRVIEPVKKQDFGDSAVIADPSGNVISLIDLSTSKMPHDWNSTCELFQWKEQRRPNMPNEGGNGGEILVSRTKMNSLVNQFRWKEGRTSMTRRSMNFHFLAPSSGATLGPPKSC